MGDIAKIKKQLTKEKILKIMELWGKAKSDVEIAKEINEELILIKEVFTDSRDGFPLYRDLLNEINMICKYCDKPPELCSCPDQELIEITSEDSFAKGGATKIVKLNIERSN